jgi:uncharacterized protein YfaS (alpha-2-macroglobulin family)
MADLNEHVADLVDDYLHALLSPGRAGEVEQHCAACPACQAALEEARRRRALLQAVPPSEASGRLIERTLRRISEHDQTRRRRRARGFVMAVAALAASALVLVGVQMYYRHLTASPYDLVVLGQHNLLVATTGSLRVLLVDRLHNTALAGVPVVVELRGQGRAVELARFDTDAHGVGQPRFRLPDWPDGDYGLVVTAQTAGGVETITRTVRLKRSWKLMLSSDKPAYQPGQTIHIRTLALRQPDLRPVAGRNAVFTLADPKGNILFKQAGPTSAFGIVAADCRLAREVAEGAYTLACKIDDTESRLRIDVQKYVLPKFKIEVQPDRAFYQPKETARLTMRADYFFGQPVADAAAEIEVRTLTPQPTVIQHVSLRTDADGKIETEFALPDMPAGAADMRLSFNAVITDRAGQKQTRGVERVLTRQPVRVEVLPENGKLVQGVANIVYLLATRADGSPVRARLEIGGLNEVVDTDANGLASCEVTPTGAGVNWQIVARDAVDKVLARRDVNLPCGPAMQDFLLRTDRGLYESGQTMKLTADGGGNEPVFLDFLKDDQTLLSETITIHDGHGACAIDLPPDLFGTVRLCAYRMDADGVRRSKTRVVYIRPAGQLKIAPKLDRKVYRPGRRAHLELALTSADGTPTPGAISLAGVDEAVFSVLPQRPGQEQAFYTLERQLLQPVYNLYPWSPEHRADEGRLEQALFAATTHDAVESRHSSMAGESWRKHTAPPRDASGLHSLTAASLPGKVQQVERERASGERWLKLAWMLLVSGGLILGYMALWVFLRPAIVLILHGVALVVLLPVGALCLTWMMTQSSAKFMADAAQSEQRTAGRADGAWFEGALVNEAPGEDGAIPQNFNVDRISDVSVPGAVNPTKGAAAPRVRKAFPETLLWTPQLVTDDQGRARLDIELADAITTWRISASAVAADGRLGATELPLKVFQPFFVDLNLPVTLTRNDEVSMAVVVYNYLDRRQTVTLKLQAGDWFALTGDAEQRIDLAPREVRSTSYRLKATKVGRHSLQVSAHAADIADALKRTIEVVPDGRLVEHVYNGSLQQPGGATLVVPESAIEGSVKALVKIYPSGFSQLVEGLDNIFRMPSGCFEQTSSTTYPNILALDYLRKSQRSAPAIEAKARQYLHLGYQRLVGFEIAGGGFDWFGHPPANRTLTAYGLMEFEDMAAVHDVDPQLIARTRQWLLAQRKSDGSWAPESHALHEDVTRGPDQAQARLATTAYIAWAVFAHDQAREAALPTRSFLTSHAPESIADPHILALVANALLVLDPEGAAAGAYLDRLEVLKQTAEGGKHVFWRQPQGAHTTFFGAGQSGAIETTALATLALLHGQRHPGTSRAALAWLVAQKDPHGTWHSTQATVLTLKALLAAMGSSSGDGERRIVVRLGDRHQREIVLAADQAEVLHQLDMSSLLTPGRQRLELTETTRTGANYQVTLRYHLPEKAERDAEPLTVHLDYDRTQLKIGETVKATAKAANPTKEKTAMVMLDLPVPAGFAADSDDFAALIQDGRIARYEVQPGHVLVYLRELAPGAPRELSYRLRATMAVKVHAPGARIYAYYDPDRQGHSPATSFTVTARP